MGQPQTFRSPTAVVVWVVWLLFAVGNWIDLAVQGRDHASAVAAALLLLATGVGYVFAQRPRIIADDAGLTIRNPLRDHRIGWAGVAQVDVIDLLRVHCDGGVPGDKKEQKVISAWAVHYSRRRQFTAEARARRAARPRRPGLGFPPAGRDPSYGAASVTQENSPEAEADKVVRLLSERATAARAEAVWAGGTATTTAATTTSANAGAATSANAGAATSVTVGAATSADRGAAGAAGTRAAADSATTPAGWPVALTSTWNGRAIAALVIPALIVLIVWLL